MFSRSPFHHYSLDGPTRGCQRNRGRYRVQVVRGTFCASFIFLMLACSMAQAASIYDWGDAPDAPYPTLNASNGARHDITVGTVYLGAAVEEVAQKVPHFSEAQIRYILASIQSWNSCLAPIHAHSQKLGITQTQATLGLIAGKFEE